jgi:hypothetical protein
MRAMAKHAQMPDSVKQMLEEVEAEDRRLGRSAGPPGRKTA